MMRYKSCPGCGKLIKWEAVICPYCNLPYPEIEFQEPRGGVTQTVNSDKNFRTNTPKRPISIVLVVLLEIVFLTTILVFLFTPPNLLLLIIIYFPIFIIITFSLIFVNLRKIKSRSLGFLITTCVLLVILIISSVAFSNMQKKKNIVEAVTKSAEKANVTAPETTTRYKIAFMSERDGNREIYIMNMDGSGQVNLTNNPAADWLPSFSPNGSKIAFTSDRDGNNEIYIMNVDGSEQVRLTNNLANDYGPSFSPIP